VGGSPEQQEGDISSRWEIWVVGKAPGGQRVLRGVPRVRTGKAVTLVLTNLSNSI
jgi:hypothetical protein